MATKKKATGKRYTPVEKQQIVDFVNGINAEKGRGGVTAAVKKFGASALTIAGWVKGGNATSTKGTGTIGSSKAEGNRGRILDELRKLDREISVRRKELEAIEQRFEKLKSKL